MASLSFQGKKTRATIQIKNFAPFATCVHCHGHNINLAVKTLSQLVVFASIEDLMHVSHVYFSHLSKKYMEYKSFAETIDTKGLKLPKNVNTHWLSLPAPML
jgi:hypothetical protein